jgi:hypothetical protein
MVNWFGIGKLDRQPITLRKKQGSGRFFIKQGETRLIVILDDIFDENKLFVCYEHNPVIDGQFFNFFTCSIENCFLCKQGNVPSDVKFLTVLDVVQDNNIITDVFKCLFPIKWFGNVYYAWEKIKLSFPAFQKKTLRFAKFAISRISTKEPAVGGSFTYLGHATDSEIKILEEKAKVRGYTLDPINYSVELAPKDEAFFNQLINNGSKITYKKPKYNPEESDNKKSGWAGVQKNQFTAIQY